MRTDNPTLFDAGKWNRVLIDATMKRRSEFGLRPLEHRVFPLSQMNDAMAAMSNRNGGFKNFIVDPTPAQ